jgi:formylglycine-generating enzyme required for sulfatase activity
MSDRQPEIISLSPTEFQPNTGERAQSRAPVSARVIAAIIAVCILAYCLSFLFTARSISILVDTASTASIDIKGIHLPFGERFLVRPGSYPLTVTASGYQPFSGQLVVTEAEVQTQNIPMTTLPGTLVIESSPSPALVSVEDKILGPTPLTLDQVEAGELRISLSADRYLPYETTIDITGREIVQRFAVSLTPGWARVAVKTVPEQVTASVDGTEIDATSNGLEVMEGFRQLRLSAPGFVDEVIEINAVADTDVNLGLIELTPAEGLLSLTSIPSGAAVTRDGRFVGITPTDVIMRPDEPHLIELSKVGYMPSTLSIALEKGARSVRELTLAPLLGDVEIEISPPEATLKVNGQNRGKGSTVLTLPNVEQVITVEAPGYAPVERRVTPRSGLKQKIQISLLTIEDARKASIKAEVMSSVGQTLALIDPLVEAVNEFSLGAPRRDAGRGSNEVERRVKLTRAFYLSKTEVSNEQFRQFTRDHDSGQAGGKSLNREQQPAVQLSWQQAASFCNWLSRREGLPTFYIEREGIIVGFDPNSKGYRLPTEAEWAYATRIQDEAIWRFAWGEAWPPSNGSANLADAPSAIVTGRILNGYSDGAVVSADVGTFPPNPRGLYDMGGNVAEWVNDVYRIPVPNEPLVENPMGELSGDNYTIRGASWGLSRLRELRLTYRDYGERGRDDLGFRVARYAE